MHRSASSAAVVSGAFFLTLVLGACGQGTPGAGSTTSPTTATTSESASPSPSPTSTATSTATTTAPTTAGWSKYTTKNGEFTFEYPSAWKITDPAGELAEGKGVFVEIKNAAGKPMATLRSNMATGSTCTEKYPYSILDTQPLPALAQRGETPRFVFESRMDAAATDPAKMNVFSYGIMSGPEPTGPTACPIFQFFYWPPNAAMFSGAYNPFDTTGGSTPGVDTPHAYMETPEYHDIKKMITSVKPAS